MIKGIAALSLLLLSSTALAQAKDDKKKWDVAAPPAMKTRQVPINVSEGTWMNVDVSPGRAHDRLRSAGRYLHHADLRRPRYPHCERTAVRGAAALLAGRTADRLHLGPRAAATISG
jgi:hypothetical protein